MLVLPTVIRMFVASCRGIDGNYYCLYFDTDSLEHVNILLEDLCLSHMGVLERCVDIETMYTVSCFGSSGKLWGVYLYAVNWEHAEIIVNCIGLAVDSVGVCKMVEQVLFIS